MVRFGTCQPQWGGTDVRGVDGLTREALKVFIPRAQRMSTGVHPTCWVIDIEETSESNVYRNLGR